MSTYALNVKTGATTRYEAHDFDSYCQAEDGQYYGIRADGIYRLEGGDDAGVPIRAFVDFGRLDFGGTVLKHISNAYATGAPLGKLSLHLAGYDYPARSASTEGCVRFDVGKGLRKTYFEPLLTNRDGADFRLDSFELAAIATSRRI